MNKTSVKINIFYQMVYEIFALLLPLITSPYVSRVLGAENIGIYSYTYSIASYFGMFAMLGVKNHGNRAIAKVRDDRDLTSQTFINIYAIQFFMSVFIISGYLFYCAVYSEYIFFSAIQLIYVISYMLDINWLFFGLEIFKQTSIRNMIIKCGTFIATFVFVRESGDLWKYCLILAAGAFFSEFILWFYLPKYVTLTKPELSEVKKHFIPMFILYVPILATSLYNFMDKIMVGTMSSKMELGFYENAEKITNCVKTVILSIGTVMLPRMSFLVATNDKEKSERYMSMSVEFIMFLAFAFSFGVASVADEFAPLYWGNEFSRCGILLRGLSVALPFCAFGNFVRTQYMIPNHMDNQYIIATILSAVINAVFNTILIPFWGSMGAVFGTIIAESVLCIAQYVFVRKKKNLSAYIVKSFPYFIMGLLMFILTDIIGRACENIQLRLCIKILLGAVIYVGMTVMHIIITKKEVYNQIISRWRSEK